MQKSVVKSIKHVQIYVSLRHNHVRIYVALSINHVHKNVYSKIERTVFQQLTEWKSKRDRKPLILNGARQLGKTWLLRKFAKREYSIECS